MPSASSVEDPSVFISYSHESSQRRAAVFGFAAFLREQGVVAMATFLDHTGEPSAPASACVRP
jgi:hypothetical protein